MNLLPFNYKKLGNQYLLVNDAGDYAYLDKSHFQNLIAHRKADSSLKNKFWFDFEADLESMIYRYRLSKSYLNRATSLFIFVLTNRCNLNCIYCQASKKHSGTRRLDMSFSTAKKALDFIYQSPSSNITIEFQGGEPLINFETLKYVVEYTKSYQNLFNKHFQFNLVSNLLLLNDKSLDYIFKNKINICTSLDGNMVVHDNNRPRLAGGSYSSVINRINYIKQASKKYGIQVKINAIQTTTRKSLNYYKEIIDTYISLGFDSIFLRPLNPFGNATTNYELIGYTPYEFIKFYKNALKYILEINHKGTLFIENTTRILLTKILGFNDSNYVDLRSPCGATIGQIAINYDGALFTCDEGRMLAEMGDNTFNIGHVDTSTYEDVIRSPVTQATSLASCAESAPRCSQCVYRPYCGICPVINYATEKDIFKNSSYRCLIYEGILDVLFYHLKRKSNQKLFNAWIK